MRKKIVAANWKMNKNSNEVEEFIRELKKSEALPKLNSETEVIIAAPYIYLQEIVQNLKEIPHVFIAAQNCHQESKGAYTGEISAEQLQSIGVTHVILGHSERRQYFNESDELILQKIKAALNSNLTPVFCCGEPLEVRNANQYKAYIQAQLDQSVFQLDKADFEKIVVAYEPIWAIGTGNTASSEQAQEVHRMIRELIAEKFGTEIAAHTTILYGGSCKPSNASELFGQKDVDGGLIGGASLKVADFEKIIFAI